MPLDDIDEWIPLFPDESLLSSSLPQQPPPLLPRAVEPASAPAHDDGAGIVQISVRADKTGYVKVSVIATPPPRLPRAAKPAREQGKKPQGQSRRKNPRRGLQGEAEDDEREAVDAAARLLEPQPPPSLLESCVKLCTDARQVSQTLLNPEGRGGCWLFAFMAALWNVLWHNRSVPGQMQPTIRCRIIEAFARKKLVNAWNQAIEEEGHGKGGAFANHVKKYFHAGSAGVQWLPSMHMTTTDKVDGGWGGEPALSFLMAALNVEQLVILTAEKDQGFDGMSQNVRVGSLMTIVFDPYTNKFGSMEEKVLTMDLLAATLQKTPFVPVVHFFREHYYAVVGSGRSNDFMAHAFKYHPKTFQFARALHALLVNKTDDVLRETFHHLVEEIMPCRPFNEWDPLEPLPAPQDHEALPLAAAQDERVAEPALASAHSNILASLKCLATIGSGVEVRLSGISEAGHGLFATRSYESSEYITEYDGDRNLSKAQCLRRNPQTHICQKDGFYVDGYSLSKAHADGKSVTGRGGGTFVNMESLPGMPANATIMIQRNFAHPNFNRILIRVLKGCHIALGSEILVDKQSYGTASSQAVAMGSKRIEPPGAVSDALPRAEPEDELAAEFAPAPGPAVVTSEQMDKQMWIDFVNDTCNLDNKTMFEAKMLLNYLSTFDWEVTGVTDNGYFEKIVRQPFDQIKNELLLLRPKFYPLKLHVFMQQSRARVLERDDNKRKASEKATLEEHKRLIRSDPIRVAALKLDIVILQSRFDYRITREFAFEVLSASEREKNPDWIGKSESPIFFYKNGKKQHEAIGVGPKRDPNDDHGFGWKLTPVVEIKRKSKEVLYRRTELMKGVELSSDEVNDVFPIQTAKPCCGVKPGQEPKSYMTSNAGFLDISKEGTKGLHWDSVIKLKPLAEPQAVSARGTVPYRTNSKYMRRFRNGRFCLLEALVFATGKSRQDLNLKNFTTAQHGEDENGVSTGISFKDVNARFQVRGGPPFELSHVRQDQDLKRTFEGKELRKSFCARMSLHSLICLKHGIYVATVQVDLPSGKTDSHAIVWDAWRRILFLGPGDFNDHQCDGAILVEEADIADELHASDVCIGVLRTNTKMTLSDYVYTIFGIRYLTEIMILMVNAKRKGETEYFG